ncbi:MAG: cytochrome c oxidase accessory protein CcoG [Sulfurimonadaceae bacterium]
MSYAKKRYLTYAFITIFTLVVPFITINGNHLLLLSFDKFQFHFIGFAFSVSEFYVMPFLLMALFIGIYAITTILGRFWCGWTCPQTIFRVIYRDLIEGTLLDLRRIKNKQKEIDYSKKKNLFKTFISLLLWMVISLIISANFIWYFVPPEDFFAYLQNPSEHLFMIMFVLSLALFLVYDIVFLKEKFCVYVCPYSRVQTVLYDDDTKHVIYDTNRGGAIYENAEKSIFDVKQWSLNEECTTCEACVTVCPTHIDIRKGLQLECINCLECSDACTTVMGKLGKESLISWGSTNFVFNKIKKSLFSKRSSVYLVFIVASLILAIVFASGKEYLLININKTGQLYRIDKNGLVNNGYVIAIHNTQDKAYTYDIKLEDSENFSIRRFKPFTLGAMKRAKKVLIIETKKRLFLSDRKDSILKLKITVFAKEDPKVNLTTELAFIYPRNDLIK